MLWVTDFISVKSLRLQEEGGAYHADTVYHYLFQETKKWRTSRCVGERSSEGCWRKGYYFLFQMSLGTETKYKKNKNKKGWIQTLITWRIYISWSQNSELGTWRRLPWSFIRKELRQRECKQVRKTHMQAEKSTQDNHCSKKVLYPLPQDNRCQEMASGRQQFQLPCCNIRGHPQGEC